MGDSDWKCCQNSRRYHWNSVSFKMHQIRSTVPTGWIQPSSLVRKLLEEQDDQQDSNSNKSSLNAEEQERLEHYLVQVLTPAVDELDRRVATLEEEKNAAPSIQSLAGAMGKLLDMLEADIELIKNIPGMHFIEKSPPFSWKASSPPLVQKFSCLIFPPYPPIVIRSS